jgi:hypothetical protein
MRKWRISMKRIFNGEMTKRGGSDWRQCNPAWRNENMAKAKA